MLSAVLRILIGFIVACLVAGVATVAFVITPADVATLPADLRADRLGTAGALALFAATHSAIFSFPFALIAIALGEWWSVRSWIYYVVAGILIALAGFGAYYYFEVAGQPSIVNDYALRAFFTVGFFGGLAYWLVAGRRAGGARRDRAKSPEKVPAATEAANFKPPADKKVVQATS